MPNIDLIPSDIDWEPLNQSGNFFRTRKAILSNSDKLIFRPTFLAVLSYITIIYIGYFAISSSIIDKVHNGPIIKHYIGIAISGLIELAGVIALWVGTKPVIFNKNTGIYYRQWKKPMLIMGNDNIINKKYIRLNDICSLQILSHLCFRGRYGYQLNIVLINTKRVYVVGHMDIKQIRKDAKLLSNFLDVPIWEAIDLKREG